MNYKLIFVVLLLLISNKPGNMMCGGFTENKEPTDEVHELAQQFKTHTEEKLGKTFTSFTAIGFKSQVVAGINYLIDVQADEETVQIKVFKPLPHTGDPAQLSEAKLL